MYGVREYKLRMAVMLQHIGYLLPLNLIEKDKSLIIFLVMKWLLKFKQIQQIFVFVKD